MGQIGVRPKDGKCGMCGVAKVAKEHACPWDEHRGKSNHKCDCCPTCTQGCKDLIDKKPFDPLTIQS